MEGKQHRQVPHADNYLFLAQVFGNPAFDGRYDESLLRLSYTGAMAVKHNTSSCHCLAFLWQEGSGHLRITPQNIQIGQCIILAHIARFLSCDNIEKGNAFGCEWWEAHLPKQICVNITYFNLCFVISFCFIYQPRPQIKDSDFKLMFKLNTTTSKLVSAVSNVYFHPVLYLKLSFLETGNVYTELSYYAHKTKGARLWFRVH